MQEIIKTDSQNLPSLTPTTESGAVVRAVEVVAAMMTQSLTAKQVSEQFNIPFLEVVELLGDPIFLRHFSSIRKEAARAEFHAVVHSRMAKILQEGNDMSAVSAANTWATILGERAEGKVVHEHSWIDETIRKLKGAGKVIDVEIEEIEEVK